MKPSAAVIALPVFAFSANTGAQKPFTWNSPVLTRFFAQLRPLSAGVDFHGVDDWLTYNSDAKKIPVERTPGTLRSCSFTAATSVSRKPLISPRVWRGKGVEIDQLIFPTKFTVFF